MYIKRLFDILMSTIILIGLSPIMILCMIIIILTSRGPVFFKQRRVGKNGKVFHIYKFRSMKVDRKAETNFEFHKDAIRVTPFGKFMRRTKVDELPQLVNVLIGDMSIVGPRPTIEQQVEKYSDYQRQRLAVRPGLTGLAQTNGNGYLTWEERIDYDIEYINNWSFFLDLKIIIKTIGVVIYGEKRFLKKKVSSNRE